MLVLFFFFSSRRRHTRSLCDWSSDVCSSDLAQPGDSGKLVVQGVVPGSAAEAAGLEPGDVLLKVGEIETRPDEDWGVKFRDRYRGQAGAPLVIGVTRAGRALSLSTQVRERTLGSFEHTPAP